MKLKNKINIAVAVGFLAAGTAISALNMDVREVLTTLFFGMIIVFGAFNLYFGRKGE